MRTSVLRWVLAISALALLVWRFWPNPVPPPPPTGASGPPPGVIPKCPEHPFKLTIAVPDSSGGHGWMPETVSTIDLAGELTEVVEVHDCQRLITTEPSTNAAAALSYGPLALIFAGDSVKGLFSLTATDSGRTTAAQRAAAVIYSWWVKDPREGDYPALGIRGGWNCLYIERRGNGVVASMVPAEVQKECLLPPSAPGTALEVRTQKPPVGMTSDDIPPVARWAWSTTASGPTNSIWIRCGDLACEIGPSGFKPEADLPLDVRLKLLALFSPSGNPSVHAHRVIEVKGWYDQQLLAVPVGAGLGVGNVLATIIPWPELGANNDEGPFERAWEPVAVIYLPKASSVYASKLNLDVGLNVISMRHGAKDAIFRSDETVVPCVEELPDRWWAQVARKDGNGAKRAFCMNRFMHGLSPDKVPGTVRWQWLEKDESTWIRCPKGCCPIG